MENIFNISNDVLSVESFEYWLKEYFNGFNWEKELDRYDIDRILKKSLNKLFSDFNFKEEKLSKILKYYDIDIAHSPNIEFVTSETKTDHRVIIGNRVYYLTEDKENGLPIAFNSDGTKFKYYIDADIIDIRLTLKNKNNPLSRYIALFTIEYSDGKITDAYSHWGNKINKSVQLEYYIYYVLLEHISIDISLLIDIHVNTINIIKRIKRILYYTETPVGMNYTELNYETFKKYSESKNKLKEAIKILKVIPLKNLKINNAKSIKELTNYVNT